MSKASLELGGGNWAAKDTKLLGYAVGDTSGKYLPREFTFSRGADIAATRVNEDGLVEKYRENILLQSNQFDTTWSLDASMTLTSGQSGYDGSSDAWLLDKTAIQFRAVRQIPVHYNVVTFSVYAKQGTLRYLNYYSPAGDAPQIWFDLQAGAVATKLGTYIEVKMESVGDGWYRCSVTYDAASGDEVRIYPQNLDGSYGSVAGNIYIQDAQLEQGLVATDYLESGSTTGKAGVLDNLPRIDYTSGSAQLLMEPSRTNKIEYSEYFNAWTKQSNVTVTDNSTTSPSGFNDASKYSISASTDRALDQTTTLTSGVTYTFSMWVKAIVDTTIRVRSDGNDWSEDISLLVSDGWKRIESTHTMGITEYEFGFFDASGSTGDRFYIWGAQLEAGSFATSYIPTYGAQDTRNFDDVDHFDTSVLGFGTTCSIYFEGIINEASSLYLRPVTMFGSGFDTSERFLLFGQIFSGGTYTLTSRHNSGGATNGVDKTGLTVGEKVKCVSVFDGTSQKFFVNGSSAGTDTVPAAEIFEYLDLSNIAADQNHTIESLQLYPVALSDEECIALTTL